MTPDEIDQTFRDAGLSVPAEERATMADGVAILLKFIARLDDAPIAAAPGKDDAS
jgi:hypothetical protein